MTDEERNKAIDEWIANRIPGRGITNAELIELLKLLPPDDVPELDDYAGVYGTWPLEPRDISITQKTFHLFIGGYEPSPNSRIPEDHDG